MMSACSQCHYTSLQYETLRQAALDEINLYRKLLQLPPQSTLTVHRNTHRSTNNKTTPSKQMSLQAMPTEIIDRIVSFVGSDSIMQLCHSLPELKHIYRCIYNVALAFPEFYCEGPEKLWPEFQFPCEIGYYSNKLLDIPVRHFYTIYSLTSLVSRYGGSATFSWGDEYDLVNIMPLLPKKVCITNAYDAERSKCNEAMFADLYMLKTCKFSCIQMLFLPFDHSFNTWAGLPESKKPLENLKTLLMDLNICGLSFWGAIPHFFEECVLPYMRNLTELHICDPHSIAVLKGCKKLEKLRIELFEPFEPKEMYDLVNRLPQSCLTQITFVPIEPRDVQDLCDLLRLEEMGWRCSHDVGLEEIVWFKR